MTKRVIL